MIGDLDIDPKFFKFVYETDAECQSVSELVLSHLEDTSEDDVSDPKSFHGNDICSEPTSDKKKRTLPITGFSSEAPSKSIFFCKLCIHACKTQALLIRHYRREHFSKSQVKLWEAGSPWKMDKVHPTNHTYFEKVALKYLNWAERCEKECIICQGSVKLESLVCDICGHISTCKKTAMQHYRDVHEKGIFCTDCYFRTSRIFELILHFKTKHLKVFDFSCPDCVFSTNNKGHFKQHLMKKHGYSRQNLFWKNPVTVKNRR